MKQKKLIIAILALGLLSFPLFSQTDITSKPVFAPFVSRITAEVRNNLIRLTWKDSPDVSGPVYVYRSTTPFHGKESTASIRPVEVPYGLQSYIDEIENTGTRYYFIVASDTEGRRYGVSIPLNNMISVSIKDAITEPFWGDPYVSRAGGTAETLGPGALRAAVEGEDVVITFMPGGEEVTPVLYRSVNPITRTKDLLSAVMVSSAVKSPFLDHPVPGIPYYYAIVSEENLARGEADIIPGRNATTAPVVIAGNAAAMRAIPLPRIALPGIPPDAPLAAANGPLSGEPGGRADKALGTLGRHGGERDRVMNPEVFVKDLESTATGGDLALKAITENSFCARDWRRTITELRQYLDANRTREQASRARFYIGQSLFFLGQQRDALFEFLLMASPYEEKASEWINAILTMFSGK